jgi:predicted ATPase/class 3 adenylate cyclase
MDGEQPRHGAYRFGRFVLDLDRGALLADDGAEVALRPKSYALLRLFVENAGRLLDRDAIMAAVWPGVFVADDSVTQCVRDIRRALDDENQTVLRTVQRRGYVFTAPVSRVDAEVSSVGAMPEFVGVELRPSPPGRIEPAPSVPAERRHLTVLVCEFASLNREQPDDPEDLGNSLSFHYERTAAAITARGGHVATNAGNRVLAFFGYPVAREDAAERAVRAGLAIVEANDVKPPSGPIVELRIGIATGLMVSNQEAESAQAPIAIGKPLALAAGLQGIAQPRTVVIADTTRSLLGSLFDLEDLGPRSLKDFATPVRAWRVVGEGSAESRFEALRGNSLLPLVGRTHELTLLLDRWDQAKEGDGQAVLLVGEPGIGKSRLVRALRDEIDGEPHRVLAFYCSSHRADSPLHPVLAFFERAANLLREDEPERNLAKLEKLFGSQDETAPSIIPLIASLLSIKSGALAQPVVSPHLERARTLETLASQVEHAAEHQPVLLVWEDVHWADPTSLELLTLMIGRLQGLRVLMVLTCRPEFAPPWRGQTHVTGLTLNRLSRRRCNELIAAVAGDKSLPAIVLEQISAKADGMPLFAEEVTKSVLESGLLREDAGNYTLTGPLRPPAIPATLQDSLMARLDRLSQAKDVAQVAALIGREFSHELLAAIFPGREDLNEALQDLITAGLVFRRGGAESVAYAFKHALVRDVAYESLLKSKRRQLHAEIAQVLERDFPQIVEVEPEVLAHHWAEAGTAVKAVFYGLKAGQRALARSATREAVAQLTIAQALLYTQPDDNARHHSELDVQIALGAALTAAKGYAAEETTKAYVRARDLCAAVGEQRRLVPVLLGLWGSYNARDELKAARSAATQLLQLAEQKQDSAIRILGHRALGATLFGLGELAPARDHLQSMAALDSPAARLSYVHLPYDPCVSGRAWLALTLAVLGHSEQAFAHSDAALGEAMRLRHHNTTAIVLGLRCSLAQFLLEDRDLAKHATMLHALAAEQGFAYWAGLGTYFRGWAQAKAGELTAGIEEMQRGLAACDATGAQAYVPYNLALLADMCRVANRTTEARTLLDRAFDQLAKTEARYCEAELLCIDGELRLAMEPAEHNVAEDLFRRAIDIATRQNARMVQMRAAICLAKLFALQERRRHAYDLLLPIYASFTEGFTSAHLLQARSLLDSLAPSVPGAPSANGPREREAFSRTGGKTARK